MRFLIDASLPRLVADVIRDHGHGAIDVRDIGLTTAADPVIAAHAKNHRLILLTRDNDFGNIYDYQPEHYYGIVVFQTSADGDRQAVAELVAMFLGRQDITAAIAGRLVIVDVQKIRVRPPLTDT